MYVVIQESVKGLTAQFPDIFLRWLLFQYPFKSKRYSRLHFTAKYLNLLSKLQRT
jgi:hypothetical protein